MNEVLNAPTHGRRVVILRYQKVPIFTFPLPEWAAKCKGSGKPTNVADRVAFCSNYSECSQIWGVSDLENLVLRK